MFALDEVRGANVLRTRRFVRGFIENQFGPDDIGAVTLLGRGLATSGQDFTSHKRLLLEAVDKFSGGFPRFDPMQEDVEPCRRGRKPGDVRRTGRSQPLASLRSLAELMARMQGRHKALLFFTECIAVDAIDGRWLTPRAAPR